MNENGEMHVKHADRYAFFTWTMDTHCIVQVHAQNWERVVIGGGGRRFND